MAGNLLNIGKSGLFAAQAGLATTGHNIANANVAGYSRQVVVQGSAQGQNTGFGFIGSGTEVADIKRYSDPFLNTQVRSAQSSSSALATYGAQISQVDNMLADPTSGLSPALQDFFKAVQDTSASAGSTPSRQNLLSSADSLASRFQSLNGRLDDIRTGVNTEITANVTVINSYAQQIAKLNDQIGALSGATGHPPNDLIDSRDQLLLELNKHVKATVVPADNDKVTVTIGNGQPLVVGNRPYQLAVIPSSSDPSHLDVGYVSGNKVTRLSDSALSGGELGGLMEFRSATLDNAQNALGRIAIGLAATFNDQHRLGQDSAGNMGGDLFRQAAPVVSANQNTSPPDPAQPTTLAAAIVDPSALTTSDYAVSYDDAGARFTITRLSDRSATLLPTYTQPGPQTVQLDGVEFTLGGKPAAGDSFTVRPTANGAAQFSLLKHEVGDIAAAGPIMTGAAPANKGSVAISEGRVDKSFLPASSFTPATLTFAAATSELTGFTAGQTVTVSTAAGTQSYVAGTDPVPYVSGASYSFGGITLSLKGVPADGDQFTVARNTGAASDNRNLLLLGDLQSTPILANKSTTFQGAFAQLVSTVGNKAREVQVNGLASEGLLAEASNAQQSVSGVNLDEEAANLLKYQQAYQAAGKVMQIASTLFDTLLSLGR